SDSSECIRAISSPSLRSLGAPVAGSVHHPEFTARVWQSDTRASRPRWASKIIGSGAPERVRVSVISRGVMACITDALLLLGQKKPGAVAGRLLHDRLDRGANIRRSPLRRQAFFSL